jgi:curli biogenesis system outer membrane secretion channel CsgG
MKNILVIAAMFFSAAVMAQSEVVAPAESTEAAQSQSEVEKSESPEDRIQRECREWAVQDGVPPDELATYIQECVEDRQAQE